MFFSRKKPNDSVIEGSVFERDRGHDVVEQATVIWVGTDPVGIPHVRFQVCMTGFEEPTEVRILAMDVFTNLYRLRQQPIAAAL